MNSQLPTIHTQLSISTCLLPLNKQTPLQAEETASLINEVVAVPTPSTVTIDGLAYDWDLSACAWSYKSPDSVETYSVWTSLMWDEKGLDDLAQITDSDSIKNATESVDFPNNKRFVSTHNENIIPILDPDQSTKIGSIGIASPGPIATDVENFYAPSDPGQISRITNLTTNTTIAPFFTVDLSEPLLSTSCYDAQWLVATALAVNQDGRLVDANNGIDPGIKIFSLENEQAVAGPGAQGGHPWNRHALRMPYNGKAIDAEGMLWITGNEGVFRHISARDLEKQSLREYVGPTSYGAPEAAFAPQDASRWIAVDTFWNVDLTNDEAKPVSVLHRKDNKSPITRPARCIPTQSRHQWTRRRSILGESTFVATGNDSLKS
jgi:hypothetical protein